MLYVVKDGKTIHADKIVVGLLRYATPVFSADLKSIVFNPEWTVPPTIVRRSEEHTSELQSLMRISYAVFCLKKKTYTHQSKTRYDILRYFCIHNTQNQPI